MPRNGPNPLESASTNACVRTLHNCPPSQWHRCAGCGRLVYAENIKATRHLRMVWRGCRWYPVDCGPANGKMITRGGTPSLVKRMVTE